VLRFVRGAKPVAVSLYDSREGADFEAEDLTSEEIIASAYKEFPNHFGFFLPLAGIGAVKQIRASSFDIRATGRLNRLYVDC
jgi:MmeI, N-terminal domain